MSSITGLKISPCWLGMFPWNTSGMGSADLFSAGTALLRHNSALEFLKSSIVSAQEKEKYRSLLLSSSFSSWSKRGRNDRKCEFPASPTG